MTVFTQLWKAFSNLPEVTAIALGGSRSGETYDETSDYDLYIYCTSIPDENSRESILTKYCSYMEMSNQFWELEDEEVARYMEKIQKSLEETIGAEVR